jgi:hypothetical protein
MSEWGPWIEHGGRKCPVAPGTVCNLVWLDGVETVDVVRGGSSWMWRSLSHDGWVDDSIPIIRYRIRKPRGMTILKSLLENLPDEVTA